MHESLRLSGATGIEIVSGADRASPTRSSGSTRPPTSSSCRARRWRPASTSACATPSAIRPWTYEFDPSGLELLRRAIEHVGRRAARPRRSEPDATARAACHPVGAMREFHVRRTARERYAIDAALLGARGDLVVADLAAIRHLAARMNVVRPAGAPSVAAGEIVALGLLHEVGHLLTARLRGASAAGAMATALRDVRARARRATRTACSTASRRRSPGVGPEPEPPLVRLEELLLTRIANENPAIGPLRELVDDRVLGDGHALRRRRSPASSASFAAGAAAGARRRDPGLARRAPARAGAPRPDLARRPAALHPRALGARCSATTSTRSSAGSTSRSASSPRRSAACTGASAAVAVAADAPPDAPSFTAGVADEPEAFSSDSAWMPRLVLMAKSTYVWLDQLSRRYGRDIRTLDAIPDEELDTLAGWGVTGLWLIGLWQRSVAVGADQADARQPRRGRLGLLARRLPDRRRPRRRGRLRRPARPRLGARHPPGQRHGAQPHGHRLALGHRAPRVVPVAARAALPGLHATAAPDLSPDERVGIVLEDHYWDDTDAAVVFKRFDRETGDERYVYHGNDGTSFPWNDTAQLDFLTAEVREQVIRTILDVARRFPVIRFDAAMVLAKQAHPAAVVAAAGRAATASRRAPSTP